MHMIRTYGVSYSSKEVSSASVHNSWLLYLLIDVLSGCVAL